VRKTSRGFTLIELLLVLMILLLVSAIVLPKLPSLLKNEKNAAMRKLAAAPKVLFEEALFKKKIYTLFTIWLKTAGSRLFSAAKPGILKNFQACP